MNDGGSAFPVTISEGKLDCATTLRDYFAAQALRMMITDPDFNGNIQTAGDFIEQVSRQAYRYADAMLAARSNETLGPRKQARPQ